jgi:hypothetical protein
MSDVISKICSMPRDFHTLKNKSINQLFIEAGNLDKKNLVTKEELMSHLIGNPELITDWENYSSDKRVSQGWYFLKNKSEWVVGYAGVPSQGQKFMFISNVEACAEFILRELGEFAKLAPRT